MPRIRCVVLALASAFAVVQSAAASLELAEDFSGDPVGRGWEVFGDAGLFRWEGETGRLAVTWDSSKPNSYYHRALGQTLRKTNEFSLSFVVRLDAVEVGLTEDKAQTFAVAVGLLNWAAATQPGYLRGTGFSSPNLFEWDYFADAGWGATISATVISEQHQWASSFNLPVPLEPGVEYRFEMQYTPEDRRVRTTMGRGDAAVALQDVVLPVTYDDFSVDALAVMSYNDDGQDPAFAGSLRARGVVDDLRLVVPPPPVTGFRGWAGAGVWQVAFTGRPDFLYTLEASADLRGWVPVAPAVAGTGSEQGLTDAAPAPGHGFYRLQATRR